MAKVVAVSGIGDDGGPAVAPMLWTVVIGTAIGIFVGTLLIRPPQKGRS